jgi:hypothetical protein
MELANIGICIKGQRCLVLPPGIAEILPLAGKINDEVLA